MSTDDTDTIRVGERLGGDRRAARLHQSETKT
jgi:hypothetical protein